MSLKLLVWRLYFENRLPSAVLSRGFSQCSWAAVIGQLINNRDLFSVVLEAGTSKIKVLTHSMCSENLAPGSQTALFVSSRE